MLTLILLLPPLAAIAEVELVERFGAWEGYEFKEEATGRIQSHEIATTSENRLQAEEEKVEVFLYRDSESGGFVLRAPGTRFRESEEGLQEVRVRVDEAQFQAHELQVLQEGRYLIAHPPLAESWTEGMQQGERLYMELHPRGAESQVVEFDLDGFTQALDWLREKSRS